MKKTKGSWESRQFSSFSKTRKEISESGASYPFEYPTRVSSEKRKDKYFPERTHLKTRASPTKHPEHTFQKHWPIPKRDWKIQKRGRRQKRPGNGGGILKQKTSWPGPSPHTKRKKQC